MDIKDLNKAQLLLLALLICFMTSVVTGITVVSLMDQAPQSVSTPINRIVRQTVERIVPVETSAPLSAEEKKLLEDLKSVQNLSASVYKKSETENTLLGTGLLLGENKIVLNSVIAAPKEGEVYIATGVVGQFEVTKIIPGEGFTLVELGKEIKYPVVENNNEENTNASTQ